MSALSEVTKGVIEAVASLLLGAKHQLIPVARKVRPLDSYTHESAAELIDTDGSGRRTLPGRKHP